MSIAPAVAPDLPLSPLLPELFAPLLEDAELFALPLDFADVSALAEALALLLPPPALEELDDLPPPLAAFELAEEPAVF